MPLDRLGMANLNIFPRIPQRPGLAYNNMHRHLLCILGALPNVKRTALKKKKSTKTGV